LPEDYYREFVLSACLADGILFEDFLLDKTEFYDWSKRDWLGLEAVKSLRDPGDAKGLRKLLARALQSGDLPAFFTLSVYTDPFITTAYMRKSVFNGMTRRDWWIFLGSWIIGNGEWILILSGGIWIVRAVVGCMGCN